MINLTSSLWFISWPYMRQSAFLQSSNKTRFLPANLVGSAGIGYLLRLFKVSLVVLVPHSRRSCIRNSYFFSLVSEYCTQRTSITYGTIER
jgi:hypothetical protein